MSILFIAQVCRGGFNALTEIWNAHTKKEYSQSWLGIALWTIRVAQ
jgi:hypothetical protein